MIFSLRFKNFYSLADVVTLDFTADMSRKEFRDFLNENIIGFKQDKFVNILGIFGANAAGKSNIIKAMNFCRNLILNSHQYQEGTEFEFEPFKFTSGLPSEFYINFEYEDVEYEYSFTILKNRVLSESLYYYPNRRKAKVFERTETDIFTYGKGQVSRPSEIEVNTGPHTLFLSRGSSMNRPILRTVYKFFEENIWVGFGEFDLLQIKRDDIETNKDILLKALEVSDSDIVDIHIIERPGDKIQILTSHKEDPAIEFDFEKEESEGTKRLFFILLMLMKAIRRGTTFFLDEFDLRMHLRLAEFLLEAIRASKTSQLVFTSHNQTLMNKDKLRREQIIIVSKGADGKSDFTPLSDFRGLNKETDIQMAYLLGMFDGIPYTGDLGAVLTELMNKE